MADIYLDQFNGRDSWPGTQSQPIKTIQRLLQITGPGDRIYFVGTQIGQPDYINEIADYVYWNLEPGGNAESLFRAIQYIVLAQAEMATLETQKNYYLTMAENLQRFSSLFPIYARNLTFDEFRKRLLALWFAYLEPSTIQGLNRIAGAYSGNPLFAYRFMEDPWVWILNRSYIDQTPPENYIPGTAEIMYGAIFEVFGWHRVSAEEDAEFEKIFTEDASLSPFGIIRHQEDEPSGYILIRDGFNDFDLMTLDNMHLNGREVHVTDPSLPASLETYPVSVTDKIPYGYTTSLWFSLFERIDSYTINRRISYSWGSSPAPGDFGPWQELKYVWPMVIPVEGEWLRIRIDVDNLSEAETYVFVSAMMRGAL
jgi:hypothetical protein